MGLGQTMLTSMFLVLLAIAVINGNRLIVDSDENYYRNQAFEEASFNANELLLEIVFKKFDETVDTSSTVVTLDSSTFSSTMGWDDYWGEFYPVCQGNDSLVDIRTTRPYMTLNSSIFDDVDDYNNYYRYEYKTSSTTRITRNLTNYTLKVNVYYVQHGSEDIPSASKSFLKRIDVTVWDPIYIKTPLVFSTIKAYGL